MVARKKALKNQAPQQPLKVVLTQTEYERIHSALQDQQALIQRQSDDLKRATDALTALSTPRVEPVAQEKGLYLCPVCRGRYQEPRPADVKRPTRFVGFKEHILCRRCGGWGYLLLDPSDPIIANKHLNPVLQCKLCLNWYAQGAGHPDDERCPSQHASHGTSKTHCHYHDLSLPSPDLPGKERHNVTAAPAEWEEKVLVAAK